MNPYQVLGVAPGLALDDVEATYRRLLRAHHPDLHHGASAEELADAERQTRQLNEAMALIRAGWQPGSGDGGNSHFRHDTWDPPAGTPVDGVAPPPPPGPRYGVWDESFRTDASTDWFGNPVRRRASGSVTCALCGVGFDDPASLHRHLMADHHLRDDVFGPPPLMQRWLGWTGRDRFRWLRWVPIPQLTLSLLLLVYLGVVTGLVPPPWTIPTIWAGLLVYVLAMAKAFSRPRRT